MEDDLLPPHNQCCRLRADRLARRSLVTLLPEQAQLVVCELFNTGYAYLKNFALAETADGPTGSG
jgi:hypothetical protein